MSRIDFILSRPCRTTISFGLLVLLFTSCYTSSAHHDEEMQTYLQLTEGSLPPVGGPFNCVRDLDGKPYSTELVQNCLHLIAKTPYVLSAKIHSNDLPGGRKYVEFTVTAKGLVIQGLSFTVQPEDLAELRTWVARNRNNLKEGGIYTPTAESSTYQAIKQFYLARGVLVGIVPTVHLNYTKGVADLNFAVTKGPNVPPQPAYFPYGDACDDEVTYMDWSQMDDSVPLPLVESEIRLRALGICFAPELAKQDEESLNKLGIFTRASVDFSGEKGSRHVSVKIKGRPLNLAEVNIRTFGAFAKCAENHTLQLPLNSASTYSTALIRDSIDYLRKECSEPDRWVEISEEDRLTEDRRLKVFFNVLVVPLQSVFVDGQLIN